MLNFNIGEFVKSRHVCKIEMYSISSCAYAIYNTMLYYTVQPVLTPTCVQRPSVSNDCYSMSRTSHTIYIRGSSIQRPPVLRDHTCLAHRRSLNTGYIVSTYGFIKLQ